METDDKKIVIKKNIKVLRDRFFKNATRPSKKSISELPKQFIPDSDFVDISVEVELPIIPYIYKN